MRIKRRLAAFVLGATILYSHPTSAQTSVAYQINPEHNGATEFPEGFNVPLQRVWSRTFKSTSIFRPRISFPVIANGKAFVVVHINGRAPRLTALSLTNGQTLWSKAIRGSAHFAASAALAYDNGRLFVANDLRFVYAFDPETGAELWKRRLGRRYEILDGPPTARNGFVYLGLTGNRNGTLFALDQFTGKVVWKQSVGDGGIGSPTVTTDGVFVTYGCQLRKFDPATGRLLWHLRPCFDGSGQTVVFSSGLLLVRDDIFPQLAFVVNADTGQIQQRMTNVLSPPAVHDGVGYLTMVDRIRAHSIATKQNLWAFAGAKRPAHAPIVVNGKVVMASSEGDLFVLDGASGNKLQRISLGIQIPLSLEGPGLLRRGIGAGEGMVVVPAGETVFAFKGTAN